MHEHRRTLRSAANGDHRSSWRARAGELLRSLLTSPGAAWPALEELSVVGVRQSSRLYELPPQKHMQRGDALDINGHAAAGAQILVGVLPIGLFPGGHSYAIQARARAALGFAPYAVRPQLAPLAATRDSARRIARRLGRWGMGTRDDDDVLATSPPGSGAGTLRLSLHPPGAPPSPTTYQRWADPKLSLTGGLALLASHAGGLAAQLRAVRYAAAVALHLNRSLVLPPLLCYCDRDPSGGESLPGLLSNGCKLPSAESESYLPFECPIEDVIDEDAWRRASQQATWESARGGGLEGAPADAAHGEDDAVVEVPPNRSAADLATSIAAAAATLGDRQRPAARTITLKMEAFVEPQLLHPPLWTSERPSLDATALGRVLRQGPVGGWCAACTNVAIPEVLLGVGDLNRGHPDGRANECTFCLNFSRFL